MFRSCRWPQNRWKCDFVNRVVNFFLTVLSSRRARKLLWGAARRTKKRHLKLCCTRTLWKYFRLIQVTLWQQYMSNGCSTFVSLCRLLNSKIMWSVMVFLASSGTALVRFYVFSYSDVIPAPRLAGTEHTAGTRCRPRAWCLRPRNFLPVVGWWPDAKSPQSLQDYCRLFKTTSF